MSLDVFSPARDAETSSARPERSGPRRRIAALFEPMLGLLAAPSVRQGVLSVADQAVVSAAAFLTGLIVARSTSPEEYGVYGLAMTLLLLARGVQTQLLFAPYVIRCQRHQGRELAEYTGSVLLQQLAVGAAALAGLLGFAAAIGLGWGSANLLPAIATLGLVIPVLLFREFARCQTLSQLKTVGAVWLDASGTAVQLGLLGVLWGAGLVSAAGAYWTLAAAAAVVSCQWLWTRRGEWRVARGRILADWRSDWRFARWALASYVVGCTTPFIMPWILKATRGLADTGLLVACGTLAGVANLFVSGLGNYLSPSIARAYARQGPAAMVRCVAWAVVAYVSIVGGMCLVSLLIGEWLMVFIYGPAYAGGGLVLTICLLTVLTLSIGIAAGNGLWAMHHPHETFLPDVAALVTAMTAAALLMASHGALGAALAGLAGTGVGAALKSVRFVQIVRKLPARQVGT
jgi:O-antigen/teichoic acid export membrane protein